MKSSSAQSSYFLAFAHETRPFLSYYQIGANGWVKTCMTRGQFWDLALQAAATLSAYGLGKGDCHLHCFAANQVADLAFRLGACLVGSVPVTVNWEADTAERVCYKLELTDSRLLIHDNMSPLLAEVAHRFPHIPHFDATHLANGETRFDAAQAVHLDANDARLVIFTSGTTGKPKGVRHNYLSYETNQATFEDFLKPGADFQLVVANALHHANATAICDWAMRNPGAELHLVSRYASVYWKILSEVAQQGRGCLIAPVVARHFDFLASLEASKKLPVELEELRHALSGVTFLIGSAPVGPTTVARILHFTGRLPTVRFGSTETCLQVMGIPYELSEEARQTAFEKGWDHANGPAYYIGRPHPPYTEVRVVQGIDPNRPGFLETCLEGQPGYLITRGKNLMHAYVKDPDASCRVLQHGWYTGLLDIGFSLKNELDGQLDFYWKSRESTLLIRGGANYAYDQITDELTDWLIKQAGLAQGSFDLAVVGLRLDSEHEDACCVTLQLHDQPEQEAIGELLLKGEGITKGARPNYVRYGQIPRNFKGAVVVPELKQAFRAWLLD